jgi:hypothetical protein
MSLSAGLCTRPADRPRDLLPEQRRQVEAHEVVQGAAAPAAAFTSSIEIARGFFTASFTAPSVIS